MDKKTKKMIKDWLTEENGDKEKLAKWMSINLHCIGIKASRKLIQEALDEVEK